MKNTEINDYFLQVAQGEIPNRSFVYKFGRNPDLGATEEIIWDGGDGYVYPTTGVAMEILSDNANDTNLGTGAWSVEVFGLDTNGDPINETVVLNGTTPVALANNYFRVFRMFVCESGGADSITGANIGTLTVRTTVGGDPQAIILPTNGQTLMAMYTIPAGYKGYVWVASATVGKLRQVYARLKARSCGTPNAPFTTKATRDLYENSFKQQYKIPIEFNEMTDLIFTGENLDSGTVEMSGNFQIELIKQ